MSTVLTERLLRGANPSTFEELGGLGLPGAQAAWLRAYPKLGHQHHNQLKQH